MEINNGITLLAILFPLYPVFLAQKILWTSVSTTNKTNCSDQGFVAQSLQMGDRTALRRCRTALETLHFALQDLE